MINFEKEVKKNRAEGRTDSPQELAKKKMNIANKRSKEFVAANDVARGTPLEPEINNIERKAKTIENHFKETVQKIIMGGMIGAAAFVAAGNFEKAVGSELGDFPTIEFKNINDAETEEWKQKILDGLEIKKKTIQEVVEDDVEKMQGYIKPTVNLEDIKVTAGRPADKFDEVVNKGKGGDLSDIADIQVEKKIPISTIMIKIKKFFGWEKTISTGDYRPDTEKEDTAKIEGGEKSI